MYKNSLGHPFCNNIKLFCIQKNNVCKEVILILNWKPIYLDTHMEGSTFTSWKYPHTYSYLVYIFINHIITLILHVWRSTRMYLWKIISFRRHTDLLFINYATLLWTFKWNGHPPSLRVSTHAHIFTYNLHTYFVNGLIIMMMVDGHEE